MNDKKRPRAAKTVRVKQPTRIELEARATIARAADLHRTLSARVLDGEAVVVDGTAVEEIDTAILQLLASLWRTCMERGISCTWHGASDVLRQTAGLIGVAELLQFPAVDPAGDGGRVVV